MSLRPDDLRDLYELMLTTRRLDERLWALNRQGRVMTVAPCSGQEAAQVGSAYALEPRDYVTLSYREHGVAVTRGMSLRDMMLYALHRGDDPNSAGRQIPGHYSSSALNILSASSPVATQIPHAVGAALSCQLLKRDAVCVAYFGDGATSKGDFHEALNFAGVLRLPVVFLCQNNEYAISTPQQQQMAISDVADRAVGYGFPGEVVDGNNVTAVYQVTSEAVARARRGGGPTLIEAKTTRLLPHTSEDDDRRYRPRDVLEASRQRDPLVIHAGYLKEHNMWSDEWADQVGRRVTAAIDEAQAYAEQQPLPKGEDVMRFIYAE